jgi:hypothetical protein
MKKIILLISIISIIFFTLNVLNVNSYATVLLPTADGYLFHSLAGVCGRVCEVVMEEKEIKNGIEVSWSGEYITGRPGEDAFSEVSSVGMIEFNISNVMELFTSGQVRAMLHLTVKDGYLSLRESFNGCFTLNSMQDENEDGVIEETDTDTTDYIGEACGPFQEGETIIVDVTSALDYDFSNPAQADYSGFVLQPQGSFPYIQFYDHTDPDNSPQLIILDTDVDRDGILIDEDNCPFDYNPNQEDTFPPSGNGIGDACECEGDLDCDKDQDGLDAAKFKEEFGSSSLSGHCDPANPCKGDFDCDGAVDGLDAYKFKEDFGRCPFNNPCPACVVGE